MPHPLRIRRSREVPGRYYSTPKELWGFRLPPRSETPTQVARAALADNSDTLGLDGLHENLKRRRCVKSLGASHVIFSQEHEGRFVHRAYVTVHMNRRQSVFLVKNRAVQVDLLPDVPARTISKERAARLAAASIGRRGRGARVEKVEEVWFPRKTKLHLACKVRLRRAQPAGEWIVYVHAVSGAILWKYDNLALATGRATLFDPNPVVALGDWLPLLDEDGDVVRRVPAETYREVRLAGLADGQRLDGIHVSTQPTPNRIARRGRDFRMRSDQPGFEEVMAYYHLDAAVRYVRSLGYTGSRAIFTGPIRVNARASREDNSWYMPSTRQLGFGTGDVDDAEDGETILHEFGHALQDAICPDFGQSIEAAAMGEGFGDYFAASFFADRKRGARAERLRPCVMSWDGILFEANDPDHPPCVRRLDGGLTYESFDHSTSAEEHDNGEIWAATLWDIWNRIGRRAADRIIIESHFQLDGFTSFAKGARAIIDADRNLFDGRHVSALKQIFRRRGIGPVD